MPLVLAPGPARPPEAVVPTAAIAPPRWWQRPWIASIALGLLLGLACLLSLGAVALLAASIGILAWATRRERRAGLFRLALLALGVRWLLIIGVTLIVLVAGRPYIAGSDAAPALFGDDGYYAIRSWWLLQRILGQHMAVSDLREVVMEFHHNYYGQSGHLYPMALFYSLFGYSPTAVKGISALLGVLTGLLIADMTHEMAGRRAARIACALVWFWPSLVVWSSTNLKDPYAVFLTCLSVWAFHRWLRSRRIGYVALTAAALYAHATIKDYLWAFIAAALAISWLLRIRRRLIRWGLITAGVALVGAAVWRAPRAIDATLGDHIRYIAIRHITQVKQLDTIGYRLLPEKFYQVIADNAGLKDLGYQHLPGMALLGAVYFLLVPLPWHLRSAVQVMAYPQMLVWYGLLAAAGIGAWVTLRRRWEAACLPLAVIALLTVALGVTSGNVGTAFRHRDLLTPLYFMFAAIGICQLRRTTSEEPVPG